MRRLKSTIAVLATTALALTALPATIATTTASWPDSEWVNGKVGTSSYKCDTDTGYASTAFGRFLSGSILSQNLDPIVDLNGVTVSQDAAGAVSVDPADAIDQGSTPPTATYTNPLDVSVLSLLDIDLTGLTVGLPVGSAGAVNQYAQVSGHGNAAGAAGLVSNSGGVGITPLTPDDDLPEPATIGLSTFLPAVAGIADANLQVGAVAASSQLDWCAALRSALWGDGSVSGITRDYGIAGLGLQLDSPLLGDLIDVVNDGVTDLGTGVDSLLGSNGLISNAIQAQLLAALLPGQSLADVTAAVSLSGLDLPGSVSTLLTTPLTDGVVTIDLAAGTIEVDLDALLGYDSTSINNLAPNTELVIDDDVINALIDRVGGLLDTWTSTIVTTLTNEIRDAVLTIDVSAQVQVAVTFPVPVTVPLLDLGVSLVAPISALLPPGATATFSVDITAFAIPIPPLLTTALNALATGLVPVVGTLISTTLTPLITGLGSTLAATVTPIITALSVLLAPLPDVLSVMANVQPDQSGAPSGSSFIPADPATQSSAQYLVTALRIGLLGVVPGDVANLSFGTASAGPITAP